MEQLLGLSTASSFAKPSPVVHSEEGGPAYSQEAHEELRASAHHCCDFQIPRNVDALM